MRLLLDTHVLLWALAEPARLGKLRSALEDPSNEVLFSAVSIWEVAIKAALRRPGFVASSRETLDAALDTGFLELPIKAAAATRVETLPLHHPDPFDRLLVAQAMSERVRLYTADAALAPYSELVIRV